MPPQPRRIPTIDVLRGVLMASIICTHTLANVAPELGGTALSCFRALLSGTVGFATVSGLLVGYFLVTKTDDLARVFHGYAVRAALLVLIAHPLISVALHGAMDPGISLLDYMVRSVFVTDVLAFLFVLLVPRMRGLAPRARLALGVALIVMGRVGLLVPAPTRLLLGVRDVLSGLDVPGPTVLLSDYPLLSIAGMFLVGSWIGDRFARAERAGALPSLARWTALASLGLAALSGLLLTVWAALRWHVGGLDAPALRKLLYPDYSFSGYPVYLGATLILMALLMARPALGRVQRFFLTFGRTSLFTYVVQYFVVQTLPWALRWRHRMSPWQAFAYFAVALPLLNVIAGGYHRLRLANQRRGAVASVSPG